MHWISPSDTRVCIVFGSKSPTGCYILHIISNLTMEPLICKDDTRVVDTASYSSLSSRQLTKLLYLIIWEWDQVIQDAARWWKQLSLCRFQLYTGWWIWTPHIAPHLHVAWWNLLPFKKHLFGDSLHSQEHFVLLRGWCLGHVLLHMHWQFSLLKMWFCGQEGVGMMLQTHWQVLRSRCRLEPQSLVWSPCWHTHWQDSTSSSLSGPHTSAENMSVRWSERET